MTCGRACISTCKSAKMAQDANEEQLLLVAYCVHTATTNLPDALVKVHRYRLFMRAAAILPSLVSLFIQERQTRLVPTVLLPVKPWTLRVGAGGSGRAAGVLFKFSPGPRWINPCFASELVLIAVCAVEGLVAVAASPAVIPALAIGAVHAGTGSARGRGLCPPATTCCQDLR